jgi:adenine/guanine phosphoribosyltransferase-like PRPP-binding protein
VVVGYSFPASDPYARWFILSKSEAKAVDVVVGPDSCGEAIASMFARFLGTAAVCDTQLRAQEYLAEGTARLKYGRFNHWLPSPRRSR